jgi:flagellar hook-associated protein 1 FlgK
MSTGIFSIGVSGLSAAQMGLLATEHNVVNANTPGYSRQATVQATNVPINTGAGAIGQGVHVQTIKRMYDQFLTGQVNSAQTQVSGLEAYYSQINQIDTMLADSEAGLSPALQDFFSGVQQVASNPSLLPARQSLIASAQTMATRFHNIDTRLSELKDQLNGRISNAVTEINAYAEQLADINQRVVLAEAGYGQPPNDLLDQRDQIVAELNKLIKVTTSTNADGSYNVFIGSGQQIVVGSRAREMTATPSTADATRIVVGLKTGGGTQEFPESLITGGELGGLVEFRNSSLDLVVNELGRVAASLALTFNAQHGLGQDLQGRIAGDTGFVGDFFTISDPKVVSNAYNTGAGSLTASFKAPVAPSSPDYSGNFYTELTTSDYRVQFGAAGAYSITRLDDNQLVASGSGVGVVEFDGVSLNISAVGASGDKFLLQPTSEVARNIGIDSRIVADPRSIAAAGPVRVTQAQTNTGSMGIGQGVVGLGYTAPASPLTLTATATTLDGVTGTWTAVYSDGTSSTSTGNIPLTSGTSTLAKVAFSGMSFDVNGTPAVGDSFEINRNTGGVVDGRNALLFARLQTQNTVSDGTATFQSAYARLVADNGIRTREVRVQLDAQGAVRDQAVATRESLSGVNLDEEAANMLKYQQAYQAASKILEIGSKLFDTILSLG